MARQSTCKSCNNKFDSDTMTIHSGKKYCPECYKIKKKEHLDYENLKSYISEVFEIPFPTGFMLKQIKEYSDPETYNYKYTGIQYTIWYYKEILHKELNPKWGIRFVEYEYDNAKEYKINENKRIRVMRSYDPFETNVIKLDSSKVNNKKPHKKLNNLDDLITGGE